MPGHHWTIEPLHLADVIYPESHPRSGIGPVFAFLLRGAESSFLIDTGLGPPHDLLDRLYAPPFRRDPATTLREAEVAPVGIIITHLHFDHIGGAQGLPGTPIYVQHTEREAAREHGYTIPEFVDFPGADYRLLEGDAEITPGIRVVATPDHTPGHQSVAVDTAAGFAVIAGQAAETADEWERFLAGTWAPEDESAAVSLAKLRDLRPGRMYFSHDHEIWAANGQPPA
jgi:N-acyl homoserine lactone hydrolase